MRARRKVVLEPAPPLESLVPAGTAANSSYLQIDADPLVQCSRSDTRGGRDTAVEWQRGLTLPVYATCVEQFCAPPAPGLSRHLPTTVDARAPVLPSLFLPGFPKSATTWLFNCMLASFAPSSVGCGTLAANWTAAACGRRFLLTALRSDPLGQLQSTKETFYFGGNLGASLYGEGLLSLHGPDPRPPSLHALPSLWPWEEAAARLLETRRVRRGPMRAARLREATRRMGALCPAEGAAAVTPQACLHRSGASASGAAGVAVPADSAAGAFGAAGVADSAGRCGRYGCARASGDADVAESAASTAGTAGAASAVGAVADAADAAQQCAAATGHCSGAPKRKSCSCSARGVGGLSADRLEGVGANSCSHPACERIARAHPTDSKPFYCNWDPELHTSLNRSDAYCVHSLLPWATASELDLTVSKHHAPTAPATLGAGGCNLRCRRLQP